MAGTDLTILLASALVVFVILAVCVILVLWIALPFSVFGMKGLVKKAIEEQEKTNAILKAILESNIDRERKEATRSEIRDEPPLQ